MITWKFELIPFDEESIPEKLISASENAFNSHVFFHPTLVKAWMKTYAPLRNQKAYLVKATLGDNTALLPIVLWHKNWRNAFLKTVVPVGYSDFDYHDPLFSQQPSDTELTAFWAQLSDFLHKNLRFDTIEIEGITDDFAKGDNWVENELCPYLSLDGISNEDELMKFFKTSLRGDLRRQMRRLSEIGELKFTEYRSWEDIPAETFSEFMRQHSLRWPNAYKAPLFHENLLKEGLKAGVVHFSVLSVDKQEIAWHLGYSFRGVYYYYMPAGNQDFFKFSPTKVHLFYLLRRAVEQNYQLFDHLRGEENYKSGWSNGSRKVNSLSITKPSVSYFLKQQLLRLKP